MNCTGSPQVSQGQLHRVTSGQSSQLHRVTSGQPRSVLSECTFQNSSHYINLSQIDPQNQSGQKFKAKGIKNSRFNITPIKRTHEARTRWHCLSYRYQIKEKYKKEWTEENKTLNKCITENTSVARQQAVHHLAVEHKKSLTIYKTES